MPSNAPGVQATINTAPLGQPAPAQNSDTLFILGYAVWGPFDVPTFVTSWSEYMQKFGGLHPNSEMARAVYFFFRNGGRRAVIVRPKNVFATVGSIAIPDVFATPLTILTAAAKYASDANTVDVKVTVSAGMLPSTKKLIFESARLNVREVYDNFKITFTADEQIALNAGNSPFFDVAAINAVSKIVILTKNTANAHAAPTNLPADGAYTATGGVDTLLNCDVVPSMPLLIEELGPGMIAAPGFGIENLTLIAQAEKTKRIAILDVPASYDVTAMVNFFRPQFDSSFAAAYYPPRVQVRDINGSGQTKEYSVVGMVAGVFARAENEIGVHKAPANYRLAEVVGYNEPLYGSLNESARETLNEQEINAIAKLPEQGIKVYGARILKGYGRITAVHEQRVLNAIYYRLKRSLQDFVFQPANQTLFREIRSTCAQYLRELYRTGALYSTTGNEDDAYRVVCDESNNPPEQLQQNKVSVDVWVHIVGMAEVILVQINSVPLATDFNTLNTGGNN